MGRKWRGEELQSDKDEKIMEAQASVQVQPLTRCKSTGEVYHRITSVQSQIEAALTLTSSQLIERAQGAERGEQYDLLPAHSR
jgi:hypothetical protein